MLGKSVLYLLWAHKIVSSWKVRPGVLFEGQRDIDVVKETD